MFSKPFPQFLLKYQLKPLISLNYINVSSTSHNPKVNYQKNQIKPETEKLINRRQKNKSSSINNTLKTVITKGEYLIKS